MKRIVFIVGARPQFIKHATVVRAMEAHPDITPVLIHTGQHYDASMSAVFFEQLGLPEPDVHLGIGSDRPSAQSGRMLIALETHIRSLKPDWIVVYGDTNSTLAGALAGVQSGVLVAHVEAGLRSFNRKMPEETNRIVADHISDALFTPSERSSERLVKEGIEPGRIHMVGDVMLDAVRHYTETATSEIDLIALTGLPEPAYALATIHRAENTSDAGHLVALFQGLVQLSHEIPVVLPLHPRTRKALSGLGIQLSGADGLHVLDPVGYFEMMALESAAKLIVTDSGGVQKEAYFHRVPCVTLRFETEWQELVESGWNTLIDRFDADHISGVCKTVLGNGKPESRIDFYGSGDAAERIVEILRSL